jgi:amino acid transporter
MFALVQTNMTLVLYLLMLAAVVRLRRTAADVPRPYRIPGGRAGLLAAVGAGMAVCLFGIILSLFPTSDAKGLPVWAYEVALIAGTVLFIVAPIAIRPFRCESWGDRSLDVIAPEPVGGTEPEQPAVR